MAGRFVGQQQRGHHDEGPGQRRSLLLAHRDLLRCSVGQPVKAKGLQQGGHPPADLTLPEAVPSQSKGKLHVLLDGQLFEEPQPLGDDGQIGPRALTPGRARYSGAG